jgi:hypothetical protein
VDDRAAERVAENWTAIGERTGDIVPEAGIAQSQLEIEKYKSHVAAEAKAR